MKTINDVSETPPRLIETKVFSAMPAEFRRKVRTDWATPTGRRAD